MRTAAPRPTTGGTARRWLVGLALACLVAAGSSTAALAATAAPAPGSTASACAADTGSSPFAEFGELRCSGGTDTVQERVEAILAGAAVVIFAGAALVYRRQRLHRPMATGAGPTDTQSG